MTDSLTKVSISSSSSLSSAPLSPPAPLSSSSMPTSPSVSGASSSSLASSGATPGSASKFLNSMSSALGRLGKKKESEVVDRLYVTNNNHHNNNNLNNINNSEDTDIPSSSSLPSSSSRSSIKPPPPPSSSSNTANNNSNGGGGEKGVIDRELLLMDQLASLSQQLADSRMSNQELKEKNRVAEVSIEQLKNDLLEERRRAEEAEEKAKKIRQQIAFSAVQESENELKKLKAEKEALIKSNDDIKSANIIIHQSLVETIEGLKNVSEEYAKMEIMLTQKEYALGEIKTLANNLQNKLNDETEKRKKAEEKLIEKENELKTFVSNYETTLNQAVHNEKNHYDKLLSEAEEKIQQLLMQRNQQKNLCESLKIDAKKARSIESERGEMNKLKEEISRLKEELTRKSNSLQDALVALGVYMEQGGPSPPPPSKSSPSQSGGLLGRESIIGGNNSEIKKLQADNASLQALCNKLSLTLNEKNDHLTQTMQANAELQRRIHKLQSINNNSSNDSQQRSSISANAANTNNTNSFSPRVPPLNNSSFSSPDSSIPNVRSSSLSSSFIPPSDDKHSSPNINENEGNERSSLSVSIEKREMDDDHELP